MKYLIILLFIVVVNSPLVAQQTIVSVTYNISAPQGDLQEYVDQTSFRGFGLQSRHFVNSNLALGGSFSLEVYNQKIDDLFTIQGDIDSDGEGNGRSITADVSGVQFRYFNTIPILFTTHYYFGEEWKTRFFAGLGIGAYRTLQRTEIGLVAITNNNWQFGVAPEVGVNIPLGLTYNSFTVGARYNYAFQAGNSLEVSYLSFVVGFGFMY